MLLAVTPVAGGTLLQGVIIAVGILVAMLFSVLLTQKQRQM
jgi:hypothetical protein